MEEHNNLPSLGWRCALLFTASSHHRTNEPEMICGVETMEHHVHCEVAPEFDMLARSTAIFLEHTCSLGSNDLVWAYHCLPVNMDTICLIHTRKSSQGTFPLTSA
jgi:hypothetical protein